MKIVNLAGVVIVWIAGTGMLSHSLAVEASAPEHVGSRTSLDVQLAAALDAAGFTGDIEARFKRRLRAALGRPINPRLADLGRLLRFDKLRSPMPDHPRA